MLLPLGAVGPELRDLCAPGGGAHAHQHLLLPHAHLLSEAQQYDSQPSEDKIQPL